MIRILNSQTKFDFYYFLQARALLVANVVEKGRFYKSVSDSWESKQAKGCEAERIHARESACSNPQPMQTKKKEKSEKINSNQKRKKTYRFGDRRKRRQVRRVRFRIRRVIDQDFDHHFMREFSRSFSLDDFHQILLGQTQCAILRTSDTSHSLPKGHTPQEMRIEARCTRLNERMTS